MTLELDVQEFTDDDIAVLLQTKSGFPFTMTKDFAQAIVAQKNFGGCLSNGDEPIGFYTMIHHMSDDNSQATLYRKLKKHMKNMKYNLKTTAFFLLDIPINFPESAIDEIRQQVFEEFKFSITELDDDDEVECIKNIETVIEIYRVDENFEPNEDMAIIREGKRTFCLELVQLSTFLRI